MSASKLADSSIPNSLTPLAGAKFSNSTAREGHHLWRVYYSGTAQAQLCSISCINITEGGHSCNNLKKPYKQFFFFYACGTRISSLQLHPERFCTEVYRASWCVFVWLRTACRTDKQPGTEFNPEHLYRNSRWHFSRNSGEGTHYVEELW